MKSIIFKTNRFQKKIIIHQVPQKILRDPTKIVEGREDKIDPQRPLRTPKDLHRSPQSGMVRNVWGQSETFGDLWRQLKTIMYNQRQLGTVEDGRRQSGRSGTVRDSWGLLGTVGDIQRQSRQSGTVRDGWILLGTIRDSQGQHIN